jgi:hypothetical protein
LHGCRGWAWDWGWRHELRADDTLNAVPVVKLQRVPKVVKLRQVSI